LPSKKTLTRWRKINNQPTLFVGHGSPMNAIVPNPFSKKLKEIGRNLSPEKVIVVSAHWTEDDFIVQSSDVNPIIHDYYGFPNELYDLAYETSGDAGLARELTQILPKSEVVKERGLDHGAWIVLRDMFPTVSPKVIQLSLKKGASIEEYLRLGETLRAYRSQGVLLLFSGNIVHNLGAINWAVGAKPYAWATEFDQYLKSIVKGKDRDQLLDIHNHPHFKNSHPTDEHFLPLIPMMSSLFENESVNIFNDRIDLGSISMTSFISIKGA
jgi:4,5-DOPA dioxygenase extradiol